MIAKNSFSRGSYESVAKADFVAKDHKQAQNLIDMNALKKDHLGPIELLPPVQAPSNYKVKITLVALN